MFTVELHFHGDLPIFLSREHRANGGVTRLLSEKTAVKDIIEASGVPHPEVDLIVSSGNGRIPLCVDFHWQVQESAHLEIYPVNVTVDSFPTAPHLQTRTATRFVADGHLGKLARNLRLLGLDTSYERDADDLRLLEIMVNEQRALLTRDRRLLMHSVVRNGYCPRSSDSFRQTQEVLQRFSLFDGGGNVTPFQRCLRCNSPLESVDKTEIIQALSAEPLTLRYYEEFRRCAGCGKIYWPGTHFQKLAARVSQLLGQSFSGP